MPECAPALITPDSKLGEILQRWPALEEVLVGISPHFQALKNPVLRRTVAKVATLRQVARVSGVPLGTLVERLRSAAGLEAVPVADETGGDGPAPPWAAPEAASRSFDARPAIESGRHPLEQVMRELAALAPDEVYELVTPFAPAPLVDLARGKGFSAHSVACAPGEVRTYFRAS